ncbi:Histone transcription regulator 3 [Collariella sp. IMI 366227]|nr:Histone transcription regulator 3 [Collariella sp. IMI 366227]
MSRPTDISQFKAAFSAINVEPEENIDEEVDTTKELQVDDALKLFQNALRLHSQGPQFFDQASDAYIKPTTSVSKQDKMAPLPLDLAFAPGLPVVGTDVDGIGSTLPQTLYLSYKNHGQFVLDRIKQRARPVLANKDALLEDTAVQDDARRALDDFCVALDRDPSDAELWRKAARVAAFLKSARINRYSLEAAIELDDDPTVDDVEPPSLAEGFAGEQLKQQLQVLDDEMALSHPIMKPFQDKEMPQYLARFMDPVPFLPNPTKTLVPSTAPKERSEGTRLDIPVVKPSWTEMGRAIVQFVAEEGFSGRAISVQLPETDGDEDVQMEIDMQLQIQDSSPLSDKSTETAKVEETPIEKPTVEEAATEEPSAAAEPAAANESTGKDRRASLPTRKRSQSTAGIPDAQDDEAADLKRSKRTRRRDTVAEEVMDSATFLASQLQPLQAADQNLFQTTKNLLENLGVTDQVTLGRIAEVLDTCASDDRTSKVQNPATIDLRDSIANFDEEIGDVLLNKRDLPELSLSAFLEHAKTGAQRVHEVPTFDDSTGLREFADRLNSGWNTIHDVAYEYAKALTSSYTEFKWPDSLKTVAVDVINQLESSINDLLIHDLESLKEGDSQALADLSQMAQMAFELQLDAYDHVTNPNSSADQAIKLEVRGRLDRWMNTAIGITRQRNIEPADALVLRFLWASVAATTALKDTPRDHVLNCWHSLQREISKLTTMDFFLGLFQEETGDPVSVIESLEPVLNPEGVYISIPVDEDKVNGDAVKSKQHKQPITECASQELMDLWKFLKSSNTELRLLLWSRLGEAYGKIQYTTKQFSCFLRSIETIVADLDADDYPLTPDEPRRSMFMGLLKAIDDLIIQSLHLALNDNSSFDIIDEDHLRSSMSALAKVSCLLHVAAMYEDEVRIGMRPTPANNSPLRSFLNKLQEMQVRAWSLQYTMLKVGINQHSDLFPKPENDLADYLAAVHQVLGLRKCCKSSNKIFLKMMRVELLKQKNIDNWEDYLGQVLYDLHGLKLGVGIWEVQDHGCEPENLEKRQALQLVERVTMLANRMPMKDLLKSDLKTTIERMQQAIGSAKSSPQMAHNLRNYSEYLKAPIHPLHLYQALTGSVDLDAVTINTPESAPAKQGWFFLLGMIALTKFKGVDLNRRQTPGATDDLRIGATYLRLQLQYTPDRWDAWFRLAECFDYELDESVLWTADKMNKERAELVKFQRNAIHSYIMALSHSYAWASNPAILTSLENDKEALYDMFHEFGMRMYSSSREPFAMEPFHHSDHQRFFIEAEGTGTYKKLLHNEMSDYQVWKFAAHLFRKAMVGKPKDWKNPYMVAKCLWKMYQKSPEQLDAKNRRHRPTVQTVLNALEKTVEVVASLPKPRHGSDPILEPHYKIVSVVHKLVKRGDLTAQEAADLLQRQPYAPDRGREVTIDNTDEWDDYVIRCLKHLRDKDKSNWQHRIIMRHAHILYDEDANTSNVGSQLSARAAFMVLRESMFTKTMVMNVWKCDAERPGRHHVYTERYIRYVAQLLDVMNDRANLEAVLRRIRKKGADFYHFTELWQYCVLLYVKLLRQTFHITPIEEDAFKTLSQEDFDIVGEHITDWATTPAAEANPALDAMKEAVELKKLNANLMKASPIDDLITDCYAAIYLHLKPDPIPPPNPPIPVTDSEPHPNGNHPPSADLLRSKLLLEPPTVLGSSARGQNSPMAVARTDRRSTASRATPATGGARGWDSPAEYTAQGGAGGAGCTARGGNAYYCESGCWCVHDSADDESDLSDVPADYEDDVPPSLLFPNLRRSVGERHEHEDEHGEDDEVEDGPEAGDKEGATESALPLHQMEVDETEDEEEEDE